MKHKSRIKFTITAMALLASGCASDDFGYLVDQSHEWQQVGDKLLTNFLNMYNLEIIHEPGADYPYRGWFFGWSTEICNPGYPGCDAIFAARSKTLEGPWEVYSGEAEDGVPIWKSDQHVSNWVPVLSGGPTQYDNWHNGDPSIVRRGDIYHMVYSATGHNRDGLPFGHPDDKDSDISVVMAATSKDGIHWQKSTAPVLVYQPQWGQAPVKPGGYMHARGSYHRPSLMWDDNKFKVWFDGYEDGEFRLLYAENDGDFSSPDDWIIINDLDHPQLPEFPNPDVVRMDGLYLAAADPQHPKATETGWASRKVTLAVSEDGLQWFLIGYLQQDEGWDASFVPELFIEPGEEHSDVYMAYGTVVPNGYYQDSIRLKRWRLDRQRLSDLKAFAAEGKTSANGAVK